MGYIKDGSTLPVPFNLIELPKFAIDLVRKLVKKRILKEKSPNSQFSDNTLTANQQDDNIVHNDIVNTNNNFNINNKPSRLHVQSNLELTDDMNNKNSKINRSIIINPIELNSKVSIRLV